jgi:hypothetical protein
MKLQEILTELRRNPKSNIKISGHKEAVMYLKGMGCTESDDNGYGVSMTHLPKLGINPSSKYNTPLGIYFYPASYYLVMKIMGNELDFLEDAPYIQILKFKSDNVLDIGELDVTGYKEYIKTLVENINGVATLLGISEKTVIQRIVEYRGEAQEHAKIDSYGGYLWYILFNLSRTADKTNNRNSSQVSRSPVVWNSIFRLMGVDIITDREGIIHENELYQGVAINPRSIQLVNTIRNINPRINHPKKNIIDPKAINGWKKGDSLFVVTFEYQHNRAAGQPDYAKVKVFAKDDKEAVIKANMYFTNYPATKDAILLYTLAAIYLSSESCAIIANVKGKGTNSDPNSGWQGTINNIKQTKPSNSYEENDNLFVITIEYNPASGVLGDPKQYLKLKFYAKDSDAAVNKAMKYFDNDPKTKGGQMLDIQSAPSFQGS